jgi:hypothetical protein
MPEISKPATEAKSENLNYSKKFGLDIRALTRYLGRHQSEEALNIKNLSLHHKLID